MLFHRQGLWRLDSAARYICDVAPSVSDHNMTCEQVSQPSTEKNGTLRTLSYLLVLTCFLWELMSPDGSYFPLCVNDTSVTFWNSKDFLELKHMLCVTIHRSSSKVTQPDKVKYKCVMIKQTKYIYDKKTLTSWRVNTMDT